jgi:hypothetical protein
VDSCNSYILGAAKTFQSSSMIFFFLSFFFFFLVCGSPSLTQVFQDALRVVASLRSRDAGVVPVFSARNPRSGKNAAERALDFLTFLVRVDELFDEALGLYDFDLAAAVAKKGQKDPQEYAPFLAGLRSLSEPRMRFAVDSRLQRWPRALASLAREPDALAECFALVSERRLFAVALAHVWSSLSPARSRCQALFGAYLEDKGHLAEAAICFGRAGDRVREAACAEMLGDWAWWASATLANQPEDVISSRADEAARALETQQRWDESSRLRAWSLARGGSRSEPALAEAAARAGRPSEALLWHFETAAALLLRLAAERASLLRGQAARLTQLAQRLSALREARARFEQQQQDPDAPPPVENPSEYSLASVASSVASSAAPSHSSLATLAQGRAAQQARAAKQKKGKDSSSQQGRRLTGKPGSMHEEEWLHRELRSLIPDEAGQRATHALLIALLRAGVREESADRPCASEPSAAAAMALQRAQSGLEEAAEAIRSLLLAPCLLHGRGGVVYHQYWRPQGHLVVHVAPEHALSPAVDSTVTTPASVIPQTFKWALVLLETVKEP